MAQKRMFSLSVVDTNKFLDMSSSAQALYFHLGMHGDDDGFVLSPKKIARVAGCNDDDLRLLAAKGFVIPFDSGVVVITDWNINNTLKNDRYRETVYQDEKSKIYTLPSGKYALGSDVLPECIQDGSIMEPEHNVTKPSKEGAAKPPSPTPLPETNFGPELQSAFSDWLAYKQEKRQGYKPTGLKSLATQVSKNAEQYGEAAVARLIRECMASNWQGIIWDKLKQEAAQQQNDGKGDPYGKYF